MKIECSTSRVQGTVEFDHENVTVTDIGQIAEELCEFVLGTDGEIAGHIDDVQEEQEKPW